MDFDQGKVISPRFLSVSLLYYIEFQESDFRYKETVPNELVCYAAPTIWYKRREECINNKSA